MTLEMNEGPKSTPGQVPPATRRGNLRPEWTDGLRKLYDSVVEEPLPDSFRDLLDRLDKTS